MRMPKDWAELKRTLIWALIIAVGALIALRLLNAQDTHTGAGGAHPLVMPAGAGGAPPVIHAPVLPDRAVIEYLRAALAFQQQTAYCLATQQSYSSATNQQRQSLEHTCGPLAALKGLDEVPPNPRCEARAPVTKPAAGVN